MALEELSQDMLYALASFSSRSVTKPTQAPTWSFQQGGCLWGSQSQEEWLDGEDFPVFIWL